MVNEKLLQELNPAQRQAVMATEGPVLVLAGAGSGKTKVLTHRVAYLIAKKRVKPEHILAVTFTNKAAGEMKQRIAQLVGRDFENIWIGTFHATCARILRREASYIGYDSHFAIYDEDDQLSVIRALMEQLQIPQKDFPPQAIRAGIRFFKNKMLLPENLSEEADTQFKRIVHTLYHQYQGYLRANNAMDFDDLILWTIELFQGYPQVLEKYQNRFRYILVDEYQDTNKGQNALIKLLGARHRNVFVVGDDDQSIYRWRGAELENILNFERDFPGCRIFHLEQNYRSTKRILMAANSVVKNNQFRREKTLWTEKEPGEKIVLLEAEDEYSEAQMVVEKIQFEISRKKRRFRDFAILYRTNAQSRVLEEALRRSGISYVIVGGLRFYERKEVKDVLAYLRVVANPRDTISLRRIINYPPRGIGAVTLRKLEALAQQRQITLLEALGHVGEIETITDRLKETVLQLHQMFQKYIQLKAELRCDELARALVDEIGLLKMFKEEGTPESLNRFENVLELLESLTEYARRPARLPGRLPAEGTGNQASSTLEGYLEEVALITDVDTWDDRANAVALMTLHSAKGLEFPVVFITGLEDDLFPLTRNTDELLSDLEEERRLFYVGLTRAKEKVYLSWANRRRRFLETKQRQLSRFVTEIDPDLLEHEAPRFRRRRYLDMVSAEEDIQPMPRYEDFSQEVKQIYVGCHVRHPVFGKGVVLQIEGQGLDMKLSVFFDSVGQKKLIVKYANLEIL